MSAEPYTKTLFNAPSRSHDAPLLVQCSGSPRVVRRVSCTSTALSCEQHDVLSVPPQRRRALIFAIFAAAHSISPLVRWSERRRRRSLMLSNMPAPAHLEPVRLMCMMCWRRHQHFVFHCTTAQLLFNIVDFRPQVQVRVVHLSRGAVDHRSLGSGKVPQQIYAVFDVSHAFSGASVPV
ncbi:hypothetical protein B0H15DRAFT_348510 [Mycena belliarum]|uniref:Uncharacterized protein n=1 Tax=Mycena belliarum TaxID=1033014 RepID=A0AAD6U5N5_9AGAR|nr:hypothetical protein B0H15DRAFT_348510 [Mycena belliae]